jgi:hypothetical protein
MLAAHRQLLGRLLEEVDRTLEEGGAAGVERGEGAAGARVRTGLHTTLALFAADLPSAQLLTVEILAAGPEGVKRHDAMVEAFAERLGVGWVHAAGMLALVAKVVAAGEADRLPELEDELVATVSPRS